MSILSILLLLPLPRPVRAVPPEPPADPWDIRRVRFGRTYNPWQRDEYSWDAAEARSGLAGHEG